MISQNKNGKKEKKTRLGNILLSTMISGERSNGNILGLFSVKAVAWETNVFSRAESQNCTCVTMGSSTTFLQDEKKKERKLASVSI